jgi:NAD(P)H dehydrogenase (quinone)
MKHLVIAAHPRSDSLTMCLAHAYIAELKALGHQHTLHDLYCMAFNPILTSAEIAQAGTRNGPPEVLQAQQDLQAADAVTVIYPLWWLSMPAILKGYIDRVFARGFAYESRQGVVHGLLTGRKCVLVTLSGAPLPVLTGGGRWDAVKMLQDTHVFRAVGFQLLEHLHFDQVDARLSAAAVADHLASIRQCAVRHFGARSHSESRLAADTATILSSVNHEVPLYTPQTAPTPSHTPAGHEYREEMIRQAAYFRAQQRRRSCVEHEVEDWLTAESEIDGMLICRPRRP